MFELLVSWSLLRQLLQLFDLIHVFMSYFISTNSYSKALVTLSMGGGRGVEYRDNDSLTR